MRKILLMSSALVLGLSGAAEAACIQTPTCSSLGYTSSSSCTGGVKCPFGNAWNCTVVDKITELEKIIENIQQINVSGGLASCRVGDILFSDKTCDANVHPGKTPIAVIFDTTKKLAVSIQNCDFGGWGPYSELGQPSDILGLTIYYDPERALDDWNGKINTQLILEHCSKNNLNCGVFENLKTFKTEGTEIGDWYVPAYGELYALLQNRKLLNYTVTKTGGKINAGTFFSSTRGSSTCAIEVYTNEEYESNGISCTYDSQKQARIPFVMSYAKWLGDSSNEEISTFCKLGDILYSDKSCSSSLESGKTPIGIVFNSANRLAIALEESPSKLKWSTENIDIDDIKNYGRGGSLHDYSGKNNTSAIVQQGISKYPAAKYAYEYSTAGTKAGDWYLPAAGETYDIYVNRSKLENQLRALGKNMNLSYLSLWSSSEHSDRYAWPGLFGAYGGANKIEVDKDASGYVLPVLAFFGEG